MTATPDDARAVALGILRELRMQPSGHQRLMSLIEKALTEARIQGARDALKPAPHLDELTALSQEMGLYGAPAVAWQFRASTGGYWTAWCFCDAEYAQWIRENPAGGRNEARALGVIATPSPAIAPLREAVVAAMDAYRIAKEYGDKFDAWDACEALEKAEAAQGAAAEERTP